MFQFYIQFSRSNEEKGNLTEVREVGELPKSTIQASYLARRPLSVQQQGSSSHRKDA